MAEKETPEFDVYKKAFNSTQDLFRIAAAQGVEPSEIESITHKILSDYIQSPNPNRLTRITAGYGSNLKKAYLEYAQNPDKIRAVNALSRSFERNLADLIEGTLSDVAKEIGVAPDAEKVTEAFRDAVNKYVLEEKIKEQAKKKE
ncbi:MAG: hypothetical protein V1815_00485 [Candidatus Woesearchaeota archaeon]